MADRVEKLKYDVSIILNAHHEGRLMHPTVRSLTRSITHALKQGLTVELIIILDKADELTLKYAKEQLPHIIGKDIPLLIKKTEFGDLGLSRNFGVGLASGKYIGNVDADDLISKNFITASVALMQKAKKPVIVHPEYVISFGRVNEIWHLSGSEDSDFDKAAIIEFNPWPSISFAAKSVRDLYKYHAVDPKAGFGPEDWLWNLDTLDAGIDHVIAPKTTFFYRRKVENSLLNKHNSMHLLLHRTGLLQNKGTVPVKPIKAADELLHKNETLAQKLSVIPRFILAKVGKSIGPLLRRHKRTQAFEHYMRLAVSELFATTAPVSHDEENRYFYTWLIEEWRKQHEFEHSLYPDPDLLQHIDNHRPVASLFSFIYWDLIKKIPQNPDYIFLVPWLKTGGADLEIINHVNAIFRLEPSAKAVVIATEVAFSPWRNRLPKSVSFIELNEKFYNLEPERQTRLLASVLVQTEPKYIHLVNSVIGFRLFTEYAKQLSLASRLYVSAFCFDFSVEGQRISYLLDYLGHSIDYLQKILTDNRKVIDDLIMLQALPAEKFTVEYQPYSGEISKPSQQQKCFSAGSPLKVLWAGRLDRQKRPDILIRIATAARKEKLPIEFHIYGNQVLDKDNFVEEFKKNKNIYYHGGFTKGLGEIDVKKYDLYLTTTQYEGLPNILFEVTGGGLPIMAPAVGGIPEFIQPDKTGYLIKHYDNIEEYISGLKDVLAHPEKGKKYVQNAQRLLKTRHSWEAFLDVLAKEGYVKKVENKA